jgi:hypothetical protein
LRICEKKKLIKIKNSRKSMLQCTRQAKLGIGFPQAEERRGACSAPPPSSYTGYAIARACGFPLLPPPTPPMTGRAEFSGGSTNIPILLCLQNKVELAQWDGCMPLGEL